ncbi:hypothetical protein EZS27_038890, partial [termite gut metagenome]
MDCYWYRYIYPKNLLLFDNQKLVAPEISRGGNFALDQNGDFYSTTKAYGYIKKDDVFESYEFWLGLLNSQLFWFFIQNTGYVLRGGYYTFKTNYIQPFPVPENISQSSQEKITCLVNEITRIKSETSKYKTVMQEREIDFLVYSLYG